MTKSLVSIIVSCYNSEKYIGQTINSLLKQTYENLEIIVVNDGSTDRSEEIIKNFINEKIKYYYQENRGQSAALNFGFSKAKGAFIKFYDSDDLLHPETVEGQVASIEGLGDDYVSFVEWRRFYNDMVPEAIDSDKPHTIHKDCSSLDYITFSGTSPMYQCGIWLIPTNLLRISGLWDERLSLINDTEFFSRLLTKVKKLRFSERGYTLYRTNFNKQSLSSDFSAKGIKSALISIDLTTRRYLSLQQSERMQKIVAECYVILLDWAYPKHLIYSKIIQRRLAIFPRDYINYPRSGKIFNAIVELFGWKFAKRLSVIYYKVRYRTN